jgi:hypothetical protein
MTEWRERHGKVRQQRVLIEEFTGYRSQAYERETFWIQRLRSGGHSLLN